MFQLAVAPEIEIRLWALADADACFEAVDRNRASLREWLPWADRTHSAEDSRHYIRTVAIPQYEAKQGPNCGIWVAGNLAGAIGCHPIDWANRSCALGYWLDVKVRSRGVMTQCCAALLRYLFEELKLHRVCIRCATGNMRSCAIPQRLWFRREGVELEAEWVGGRWVDLVNWAILEDEWRQSVGGPARLPGKA
jgi:ribosomal-protein-serine acetyltransferase